ncbi:MAG: Epimerase family protein [candidate division WS2 bacterium]|nr:Epimerase family protein [Candidatus Lithacetigena glycinireducens]
MGTSHLAGKNIFGRLNKRVKQEIYQNRVMGTKNLVNTLSMLQQKPKVLVSASAVGYYGDRGEEDLYEDSGPGGDFLSEVCVNWEKEAQEAEKFGIRTVQIRTAPVLGPGGLLSKILPLYKWGLGGPLGHGQQWFPWIHIEDIVGIYTFVIERETIKGPVNSCSLEIVRNEEFSKILVGVLGRPAFLKVPKFALKLVLGELGREILASQKVQPRKLLQNDFSFKFPDLKSALENILTKL